jgi:hypothetical protein
MEGQRPRLGRSARPGPVGPRRSFPPVCRTRCGRRCRARLASARRICLSGSSVWHSRSMIGNDLPECTALKQPAQVCSGDADAHSVALLAFVGGPSGNPVAASCVSKTYDYSRCPLVPAGLLSEPGGRHNATPLFDRRAQRSTTRWHQPCTRQPATPVVAFAAPEDGIWSKPSGRH